MLLGVRGALDLVSSEEDEGGLVTGLQVVLDWPRLSRRDLKVKAEEGCSWPVSLGGVGSGDVLGSGNKRPVYKKCNRSSI